MEIAPLTQELYPSIAEIYREGLKTGVASFEVAVPDWKTWDQKFLSQCRWGGFVDEQLIGWCALSRVSNRVVYKGVAESTIYMHPEFRGRGFGKQLLTHLLHSSEAEGFWTLQAHIFPENISSVQLHHHCGYRTVGIRKHIAQRHGIWYDNLLLEYRNQIQ